MNTITNTLTNEQVTNPNIIGQLVQILKSNKLTSLEVSRQNLSPAASEYTVTMKVRL